MGRINTAPETATWCCIGKISPPPIPQMEPFKAARAADLHSVTLFRDGNTDYRYLGCSTESGGSIFYVLTSEEKSTILLPGFSYQQRTFPPMEALRAASHRWSTPTEEAHLWYTNAGNNGSLERYFLDVCSNSSSSDRELYRQRQFHQHARSGLPSLQLLETIGPSKSTTWQRPPQENGTLLIDSVVSGAVPSQASLGYDAAKTGPSRQSR